MKTAFAFILIFSIHLAHAQYSDVAYVYMASGPGIEVGTIEENEPDSHILLRTPMGQMKRIKYYEIDSIAYKEDLVGVPSVHGGRSPYIAGLLSTLLPGAGQLYNGDYGKAAFYPLSIIGFGAVGAIGAMGSYVGAGGGGSPSFGIVALALVGTGGVITMYILGIIDAAESASRISKMQQFLAGNTMPQQRYSSPLFASGNGQGVSVQVAIPF